MLARHELDEHSLNILTAAAYLKQHGHCKKAIEDEFGHVCAIGAFLKSGIWDDRAISRIEESLPVPDGYRRANIVDWNNAPETTGDEVYQRFLEVAYDPKYAKGAENG